ncbi:MAG: phospholipase D-like domain-containing protein [Candidatus Onthoplasma sp.]
MKRFFKCLFSRLTITILAIILQLCLYLVVPIVFGKYFPSAPIYTILAIFALILVIIIVNSDMTIEGQLPLIILCLIAPIVGIAFCFMFIATHMPRKIKKNGEQVKNMTKSELELSSQRIEKLKSICGEDYGQFDFIYNTTNLPAYTNTDVKFLNSGEKFFEDLKNSLKQANKYIFMEYFIIERGKMWSEIQHILVEKAKAGIDVRLMYDDLGTMAKLPSNFAKKLCKLGIKCVKVNEYSSATSSIYNNRDHRKITIIDGKVAYMGGINLADEYINEIHPYGHWKDSAVRLTGDAVKNAVCLFLQMYCIHTKQIDKFDDYFSENEQVGNGVVCPFGDGPKYWFGEHVSENVFLNLIGQAKESIYITTPYLIIDGKLKSALINASCRGVKIKIVTPHMPDKKFIFNITRSSYKSLQKNGIEILEYKPGFIHAKQMLVDNKFAIVGTINFDYRSLIHHYECGVLMYETECLKEIKNDFEEIFSQSINMSGFKQNVFTRLMCSLVKLFTPLL